MTLGHTMKNYKKGNLMHDVITGIIIMAVSIPISMGYSQIAGLPAFMDYMDLCFRSSYLHYFLHHLNLSLG